MYYVYYVYYVYYIYLYTSFFLFFAKTFQFLEKKLPDASQNSKYKSECHPGHPKIYLNSKNNRVLQV